MPFIRFAALSILLMISSTATVRSELIIDTTSGWDGRYRVGDLNPGDIWGQTFKAPSGATELTTTSIWVEAYPTDGQSSGTYDLEITGYLMAWTGSRASQPILATTVSSGSVSPTAMKRIDFDFHNTPVLTDTDYVFFFAVSPSTTIRAFSLGYIESGAYESGGFGAPYAGKISNATTRNWSIFSGDLAFEMKFTSIPELPSFAMASIAMLSFFVLIMASRIHAVSKHRHVDT